MKKITSLALCGIMTLTAFAGCNFGGGNTGNSSSSSSSSNSAPQKPTSNFAEIAPTVYDVDEIVTADKTTAGNAHAWAREVDLPDGYNHNNEVTNNAVIHSPWHTLKINGTDVPVYTARCAKGPHSFAWVDVTSHKRNFTLKVELTMDIAYGKCVVLPENKNVEVEINENQYTSYITEYGSYTYTFEYEPTAESTNPTYAPLTIMVTQEEEFEIPDEYEIVEVQPGTHEENELNFTEEYKAYVIKKGFHTNLGGISLPSNSILYIERGAYIQVVDVQYDNGTWSRAGTLVSSNTYNVKVISRGLFDCGKMRGTVEHYRDMMSFALCQDLSVEGLTIINSNSWTLCFYGCQNFEVNRNLLLGYRVCTDGIMMSECVNGEGRYNFVRTGDDAIEFKGTGNACRDIVGRDCIYEYNDVWTDKCSGYCITWESNVNMTNMTFRNNNIGFAQSNWNSDCNALDCRLGINPSSKWSEITFENIDIYRVNSPNVIAISNTGYGTQLENVYFKNINVKSVKDGTYALRMTFSATGGHFKNIVVENMNFCGKVLTGADKADTRVFLNAAPKYFDKELIIQ